MEAKKKRSILEKFKGNMKALGLLRKLYNSMCVQCQQRMTLSSKRNPYHEISPNKLCDKCRPKSEELLKKLNEALQ